MKKLLLFISFVIFFTLFSRAVISTDSSVRISETPILTTALQLPNLYPKNSIVNISGSNFGANQFVIVDIISQVDNVTHALGKIINFSSMPTNFTFAPNISNFPINISTNAFGQFFLIWNSSGAARINYTINVTNPNNPSKNRTKNIGIEPPYPFIVNVVNTTNITIPFQAFLFDPNNNPVEPDSNGSFILDNNIIYNANVTFINPTENEITQIFLTFTNAQNVLKILGYDDKPSKQQSMITSFFDNTTNQTINQTTNFNFDRAFTFTPLDNVQISNITITFRHPFVANDNESLVYKCKDWNFFNRTCLGNFTNIYNLTKGSTNTTLSFAPNDPYIGLDFPAPPVSAPSGGAAGGVGPSLGGFCVPYVTCSEWSQCINSSQSRLCTDSCKINNTETRFCIESCFNKRKDDNEDGIDCGGPCKKCKVKEIIEEVAEEKKFVILELRKIDITLLAASILLFIVYLIWHHKYFNRGKRRKKYYLNDVEISLK